VKVKIDVAECSNHLDPDGKRIIKVTGKHKMRLSAYCGGLPISHPQKD
jgi:hypothetical protein